MISSRRKPTRRSALALLAAAPAALRSIASAQAMRPTASSAPTRLYFGAMTRPGGAKGIYTALFDPVQGRITSFQLAAETPDPSFLAIAGSMLFAVNELHTGDGKVSTFHRAADGSLQPLNVVSAGSAGPCHLVADATGQALFVANYAGGALSSFRITPTGLSEPVAVIRYTGHGANPDRQSAAHTHCVLLSPDNRFLLVNDLGLDRIMVYRMNPATAALTPAATPFVSVKPGSGPRHAVFHPNRRWVYSVNELDSTVDRLDWAPATGTLTLRESISTLPPGHEHDKNSPAEIAIDAPGKFLYLSNRFHDTIAVFAIDSATGALTPRQDIPCGGKTPRHFIFDPTERWLLMANQDSGTVSLLSRNARTGELSPDATTYPLDSVVCVITG